MWVEKSEAVDVAGPLGISLQLMQRASAGGGDITCTRQTVPGGGWAEWVGFSLQVISWDCKVFSSLVLCVAVLQRVPPTTVESVKATLGFVQFTQGQKRQGAKKDAEGEGCKEMSKWN